MAQSTHSDFDEQEQLNRYVQPRRNMAFINLGRIAVVCALAPWLALTWFLCFAAYVHHALGRWPYPMVEQVTFPHDSQLEIISGHFFIGCILSLPTSIVLILIQFGIRDRKGLLTTLAIFVSGVAAICLALHFDTAGFVDWWID
jgi:hypothetical protein